MIIPKFESSGNLPAGIHTTTIEEFEERFVYNIKRREIYAGLRKLINDLKEIGCSAIYIDGSFVTDKEMPNDADVCWDDKGFTDEMYEIAFEKMPVLFEMNPPRTAQQRLYKADIFPANIVENNSMKMFLDFFQQDKETLLPKGIINIKFD